VVAVQLLTLFHIYPVTAECDDNLPMMLPGTESDSIHAVLSTRVCTMLKKEAGNTHHDGPLVMPCVEECVDPWPELSHLCHAREGRKWF